MRALVGTKSRGVPSLGRKGAGIYRQKVRKELGNGGVLEKAGGQADCHVLLLMSWGEGLLGGSEQDTLADDGSFFSQGCRSEWVRPEVSVTQ